MDGILGPPISGWRPLENASGAGGSGEDEGVGRANGHGLWVGPGQSAHGGTRQSHALPPPPVLQQAAILIAAIFLLEADMLFNFVHKNRHPKTMENKEAGRKPHHGWHLCCKRYFLLLIAGRLQTAQGRAA